MMSYKKNYFCHYYLQTIRTRGYEGRIIEHKVAVENSQTEIEKRKTTT